MKINFIKSISVAFVLGVIAASCQSEPEVGSTLYPTTENDYSAKAYLYVEGAKPNRLTLPFIKTPTTTVVPEDTISVYLKLSSAVANDVTVTVAEDAKKVTATEEGVMPLDNGALKIINGTVTIPKGATVSSEPVKLALQGGDVLEAVAKEAKNGITAITIASVEGAAISQNYNKVEIEATYSYTNVNPKGSLADKTKLTAEEYYVSDNYNENNTYLTDEDYSTNYFDYLAYKPTLTITLTEETTLSGIALVPFKSVEDGWTSCPKEVEIQTSVDGQSWTMQGKAISPAIPTDYTPITAVFYSPVKCKFVKVRVLSCYNDSYWPTVDISELWAYK